MSLEARRNDFVIGRVKCLRTSFIVNLITHCTHIIKHSALLIYRIRSRFDVSVKVTMTAGGSVGRTLAGNAREPEFKSQNPCEKSENSRAIFNPRASTRDGRQRQKNSGSSWARETFVPMERQQKEAVSDKVEGENQP